MSLLSCWQAMVARCTKEKDPSYRYYGGRGIRVCDRWADLTPSGNKRGFIKPKSIGFLNFIEDMETWYEEGMVLDRIDNDGDYTPENCQWLSRSDNTIKSHLGIKHSEETKIKMRHPNSPDARLRKSKKLSETRRGTVLCYDSENECITRVDCNTFSKNKTRFFGLRSKKYKELK